MYILCACLSKGYAETMDVHLLGFSYLSPLSLLALRIFTGASLFLDFFVILTWSFEECPFCKNGRFKGAFCIGVFRYFGIDTLDTGSED